MIDSGSLGALSFSAQTAYREIYALCLIAQLACTAVGARRFFCSERYGGFVARGTLRDALYRPGIVYAACALWLGSALCLLAGEFTVLAALANVALCRFLLVGPRWNSLSRGFGAVGHITAWGGVAVFLLEASRVLDPGGTLRTAVVTIARIDFGLIMLVAGFYKLTAGYTRNDGFESALVNPWWCYWSRFCLRLSPRHPLFALMNHSAYAVEIAAGALMLTPLYEYGALAIALTFAVLGMTLRLTVLPWMVAGTFFLYVAPGGAVDRWLTAVIPVAHPAASNIPALSILLTILVCGYGAATIAVRAGLYYNFFLQRRLPEALQRAVDALSNHLLITIWRVFTANVINFYVEVAIERGDGRLEQYQKVGLRSWRSGLRYAHAGEFVALCTTFTTLKYFAGRPDLFEERLVRYARTVPIETGDRIVFTFVGITKAEHFARTPAAEFTADPVTGSVRERTLAPSIDIRAAAPHSPMVRAAGPGTYAPAPR